MDGGLLALFALSFCGCPKDWRPLLMNMMSHNFCFCSEVHTSVCNSRVQFNIVDSSWTAKSAQYRLYCNLPTFMWYYIYTKPNSEKVFD